MTTTGAGPVETLLIAEAGLRVEIARLSRGCYGIDARPTGLEHAMRPEAGRPVRFLVNRTGAMGATHAEYAVDVDGGVLRLRVFLGHPAALVGWTGDASAAIHLVGDCRWHTQGGDSVVDAHGDLLLPPSAVDRFPLAIWRDGRAPGALLFADLLDLERRIRGDLHPVREVAPLAPGADIAPGCYNLLFGWAAAGSGASGFERPDSPVIDALQPDPSRYGADGRGLTAWLRETERQGGLPVLDVHGAEIWSAAELLDGLIYLNQRFGALRFALPEPPIVPAAEEAAAMLLGETQGETCILWKAASPELRPTWHVYGHRWTRTRSI